MVGTCEHPTRSLPPVQAKDLTSGGGGSTIIGDSTSSPFLYLIGQTRSRWRGAAFSGRCLLRTLDQCSVDVASGATTRDACQRQPQRRKDSAHGGGGDSLSPLISSRGGRGRGRGRGSGGRGSRNRNGGGDGYASFSAGGECTPYPITLFSATSLARERRPRRDTGD